MEIRLVITVMANEDIDGGREQERSQGTGCNSDNDIRQAFKSRGPGLSVIKVSADHGHHGAKIQKSILPGDTREETDTDEHAGNKDNAGRSRFAFCRCSVDGKSSSSVRRKFFILHMYGDERKDQGEKGPDQVHISCIE